MTYRGAMKWAVVPTIGALVLVAGNAAYYYIDQPDRWDNSHIINGLIGIPAGALAVYVVSLLCFAAVVAVANLLRKPAAHS